VLPRREDCGVSLLASAGLPTLAIRIPAHPVAQAVLREFGKPVAAPSANLSGGLSPTNAIHVAEGLGGKLGLILAGGRSAHGLESTIIDLSGERPALLRPGSIPAEEIERLAGKLAEGDDSADTPKSPGRSLRHYAPRARLRLDALALEPGEALLAFGPTLGLERQAQLSRNLSDKGDLTEAAANLFAFLHELDAGGAAAIAVMPIPETGLGAAINDRLRRASCR